MTPLRFGRTGSGLGVGAFVTRVAGSDRTLRLCSDFVDAGLLCARFTGALPPRTGREVDEADRDFDFFLRVSMCPKACNSCVYGTPSYIHDGVDELVKEDVEEEELSLDLDVCLEADRDFGLRRSASWYNCKRLDDMDDADSLSPDSIADACIRISEVTSSINSFLVIDAGYDVFNKSSLTSRMSLLVIEAIERDAESMSFDTSDIFWTDMREADDVETDREADDVTFLPYPKRLPKRENQPCFKGWGCAFDFDFEFELEVAPPHPPSDLTTDFDDDDADFDGRYELEEPDLVDLEPRERDEDVLYPEPDLESDLVEADALLLLL